MKYSLLVLLLAIAVSSCDSDNVGVDPGVDDPYIVGNHWIYDYTNLDSNTTIQDSVAVQSANGTFASVTLNGESLYTKNNAGIWSDGGILLYNFHPTAGDTLSQIDVTVKIDGKVGPGKVITLVEAVNIPVTVRAGTFITNKYHLLVVADDGTVGNDQITYFSPSIGVIKEELWRFVAGTGQLVFTRELIRYKIR
jgi:hypothetical protein